MYKQYTEVPEHEVIRSTIIQQTLSERDPLLVTTSTHATIL
jgi:hypothetical protein